MKYLQKHVMSKEVYDKYFKFSKRQEVNRDPNMKGCPTPDCEGYLEKPTIHNISEISCSVCKKCYCYKCLFTPHPGETCD